MQESILKIPLNFFLQVLSYHAKSPQVEVEKLKVSILNFMSYHYVFIMNELLNFVHMFFIVFAAFDDSYAVEFKPGQYEI